MVEPPSTTLDFQRLFEAFPARILAVLPDAPAFTVAAASDHYVRSAGSQRAAIVGKRLAQLEPDADRSVARVVETKQGDAASSPVFAPSGELLYVLYRADATPQATLDELQGVFFATISDELRTPLMLMLAPIADELAEPDRLLPPGRRARLELAQRNARRLVRMVDTLLDFSQIEAGRLRPAFEPVDLAALTDTLVGAFRAPIESAGLRLSTRLEALPEPVYVDREMWAKVVMNLLSNALKHTFKGGITISLFASDESPDHVELRVDDTGVGIPARQVPNLFQRFHRVKRARSRSDEGTGIGLALVRVVATLHGGGASVVSREGMGSSFRVRVRRGAAHLPTDRIAGPPAPAHVPDVTAYVDEAMAWSVETGVMPKLFSDEEPAHGADAAAGPRARILWLDNHPDTRAYVARLLARAYDVVAVADAEAGLTAAQEAAPDLILLDDAVPGREGKPLLAELRADERTALAPVIVLSARADEEAALATLEAGADEYLVKPFSSKALLARVRSCLALAKLRRDYTDKLAEANKELETFSYTVSHDLRAPLRAIDGFSKALLADYASALDDTGKRYLDRVRNATQRMAQLIDDLLGLSRISRAVMSRNRVDLSAIATKVLADLAARDPDRTVETSVAPGLVALGDARLVTVVFENLLGNAWKFTAKTPGARIAIGSEPQGGDTVFVIRDNGAGFSMEYANKLFAPFQRLHSDKEFQGTGIGLATVQRVVSRHGGRVWATAEVGQGATFYFTLGDKA